jgi:hypothetical protein
MKKTVDCTHDAGRYDYDVKKTVDRVNYFRMMSGLSTINQSRDKKINRQQMYGAIIMYQNKYLGHSVPSNYKCYSSDHAAGPANSNAYMSSDTRTCAAHTIPSYMDDTGVSSLGHRRWILDPSLSAVSAGICGGYSDLRVMGLPRSNTPSNPSILAYPSPGYWPILKDLSYKIPTTWHFSRKFTANDKAEHNSFAAIKKASVKCNNEEYLQSYSTSSSNSVMYPAAVILKLKKSPSVNQVCKVSVSTSADTWEYTVKPIDCSNYNLTAADKKAKKKFDYALNAIVSPLVSTNGEDDDFELTAEEEYEEANQEYEPNQEFEEANQEFEKADSNTNIQGEKTKHHRVRYYPMR